MDQIWFCATSKSGLGHLRRCSSIAKGIKEIAGDTELGLITNATVEGMTGEDRVLFSDVFVADRLEMAEQLRIAKTGPVVVDTAVVPGIESLDRPLILILRETPAGRVPKFMMRNGRPWDLVIVPNPGEHWLPDNEVLPACRTEAVGWIYRNTPKPCSVGYDLPEVLVATGGGGTPATASQVRDTIDAIIQISRMRSSTPFRVKQAIGPRLPTCGQLTTADETFDPGGDLNNHFAGADVVISTAGYNSVLELAEIGKHTMLIPVPRNIDDQTSRVRCWGDRLGHGFDGNVERAADWLIKSLTGVHPAPQVDLGPSGHRTAAQLILATQ